ncbi:nicotinate-nucleotide adenylyltransferase [Egicoccus halophilus]|uniref:Probable nicotinate-nucleotide adenylyltransferase n=1 Tax=Egicoccus halophilus TaxID=1670830 RepID=A0A8J3EUX4_9ACTN|nr:nicotinate-nucleotide adenylyltransferase [Egicoccus halophilus]GGI06873.1 putative nicotinate-nucleotide adenylyltransferase [Egicoccus halophilus]
MPARVGLLGGTFDPPHLGHLVVAESARVDLGLDEVRLLVAGDPWMKRTVGAPAHRVAMTRAAVAEDPHLSVDVRETARDGPTYTAQTLADLHADEPGTRWTFLLGADAVAALEQWHRPDDALAAAAFVAVTRPGHELHVAPRFADRVERLEVPRLEISSTDLRARYASGRSTRYLVPEAVDRYVRDHRLYVE